MSRFTQLQSIRAGVPPPALPYIKDHGLLATLDRPQIFLFPFLAMSALPAGKFTVPGLFE